MTRAFVALLHMVVRNTPADPATTGGSQWAATEASSSPNSGARKGLGPRVPQAEEATSQITV